MLKTLNARLNAGSRSVLLASILAGAIGASPALAQTQTPQTEQPPAAAQPVPTTPAPDGAAPSAEPAQPGAQAEQPATPGATTEKIVGLPVFSKDGKRVGAVGKVEASGDGKIAAIHVRTGGFLGFGARLVMVTADQFEQAGETVRLALTEEEVDKLPDADGKQQS
ncbi:MAG: PRC-barrel domain-containing protein [Pseudomonadota bacterium]